MPNTSTEIKFFKSGQCLTFVKAFTFHRTSSTLILPIPMVLPHPFPLELFLLCSLYRCKTNSCLSTWDKSNQIQGINHHECPSFIEAINTSHDPCVSFVILAWPGCFFLLLNFFFPLFSNHALWLLQLFFSLSFFIRNCIHCRHRFDQKIEDSFSELDFLPPMLQDLPLSLTTKPDISSFRFSLFIISLLKRIALTLYMSSVSLLSIMVVTKWPYDSGREEVMVLYPLLSI